MKKNKNRKVVKRTINEMIQKNMLISRYVRIVLSDGSKMRVSDYGIEEKTLEYTLQLSDGTNRNFNNKQFHDFEVPSWFKVVVANKERQFK